MREDFTASNEDDLVFRRHILLCLLEMRSCVMFLAVSESKVGLQVRLAAMSLLYALPLLPTELRVTERESTGRTPDVQGSSGVDLQGCTY